MRVLLVDHDSEGLEAIARAIRGVLELDCVTSKGDALLLLRQNQYDVLIACERAVDGSGLDLLGRTTRTAVPLKRIFAAAPERLQLLGPRLAPFKVQRTINYPIDLEELWLAIAQVTGGPNEETDGTIERVVLDERGIPSTGTTPRSPIPPRPPAPLSGMPPPAATAIATAAANGRAATATARMAQPQPVPEPPLRPPVARVTGSVARVPTQMRATAPAMQAIPPMSAHSPPAARVALPAWTPEPAAVEDEFADIAAQAKLGVQQRAVDDAARRKKLRLATACGVALLVAGAIVFAIETFYDPEARAREEAIAATVQKMAEQQKVTDNLTLIEIDIENAIMKNDFATARRELAALVEKSPEHPRREFLQASIDRAEELSKLSPQTTPGLQGPAQAAVVPTPGSSQRSSNQRSRSSDRKPERTPERVAARPPARGSATPSRAQREAASTSSRTYGAPLGDAPRQASIPLDAPINTPPSTTARNTTSAFGGRTLEATDGSAIRQPVATPNPSSTVPAGSENAAGTAAVAMPPVAAPVPAPPPPVDVVAAKIIKRALPVPPSGVGNISGFVVLKYTIGENGKVSDIAIVESTPPGVFDDAAQNAVRKWTYEPRRENGVAVSSQGRARLVFEPKD